MITIKNTLNQSQMIAGRSLGVDSEIEIEGPADEHILRLEARGYVSILDEESTEKKRAARLMRIDDKRTAEQEAEQVAAETAPEVPANPRRNK